MDSVAHWFTVYENAVAFLVTVGVALFLACCLESMTAPPRDKDDIFNRHAM